MNTTKLNTFQNNWYQPGGNALSRVLWYTCNALIMKSGLPGSSWRAFLLRVFGATVGKSVVIKPRVSIKYPWRVRVGDYTWIGEGCWIDNLGNVAIGAHCCLSQGSMLLCGNHNYKKTTFDLMVGEITLEDGVWIGAQALVAPGITCHNHSILTAGSIATKNLDAYGIYTGNPAVKVRERNIEE